MAITLRPIEVDELPAFHRVMGQGFGYIPDDESTAHWAATLDFSRTLAAFDDGRLVGTSGAFALETTVPGGATLRTAGVTMVAVSPSHRRRGILTEMMRGLLAVAHERGEPIATLWASESIIYPRFGYGLATEDDTWDIERVHARFAHAPEVPGTIHLVDEAYARAHFPAVWERVRVTRIGMTARDEAFWDHRFHDPSHQRGGASGFFFAAYEEGGRTEGYALYRVKQQWDGIAAHEIEVVEAISATDAAHAGLWKFLLDLDLSKTITAQHRPLDDALPLMLADTRRLRRRRRDAIWLRLVDLVAALEGRTYAAEGALTLEVRDDFCGWNPAVVRLEASADGARAHPSSASPDLVLSTSSLAAAYLGGTRLSDLARAGRVEERRAGALREADRLFATDHAAWCPQHF
ncbi:MAG: GNAT family N-acetyltransferase [Dehalococcoidia bacterium]|nr:GNAT family N-acetyltransferase [Dehalococcoidia bacterium]